MLNFDQFRQVPTVEKKNRPEISQSHVSYSTVVPPLPLPPIPSCLLCFRPLSIPLIGLTQEYLVAAHISSFITCGVGDVILWHLWPLSGPHFCFVLFFIQR